MLEMKLLLVGIYTRFETCVDLMDSIPDAAT